MLTARQLSVFVAASALTASVVAASAPPTPAGSGQASIGIGTPSARAASGLTSAISAQSPAVVDPATSGLEPRMPLPKKASSSIQMPLNSITWKPEVTGRVLVKFKDSARVRAPRAASTILLSETGTNVSGAVQALAATGSIAWQAIEKDPAELAEVKQRAEARSGREAPDLAGFVYVVPANEDLVGCAKAFNDLPEVEFVVIEQLPFEAQAQQGPQTGCGTAPGAPCQNPPGRVNCNKPAITTPPVGPGPTGRCSNYVFGSGCSDGCLDPCAGGADDVNCNNGCNDQVCCDLVSATLPACSTAGWDALCAAYANSLCDKTTYDLLAVAASNGNAVPPSFKYDPCFALRTGPSPLAPDFTIQSALASTMGLPAAVSFPFELVQVTGYSANVVAPPPMGDSGLVNAVAATAANPAFPSSAKLAMQDPSFERVSYAMNNGSCFTNHAGRKGCANTPCCVYVCNVDPACCVVAWDDGCVSVASAIATDNPCVQPLAGSIAASIAPGPADFPTISMTSFPAGGSTPDFTGKIVNTGFGKQARNMQIWNLGAPAAGSVEALESDPAVGSVAVAAPTTQAQLNSSRLFLNGGFRGGGMDFEGYESAAGSLGVGTSQARGEGITIGVIDNSAFISHEDLSGVVTLEQGQTLVTSLGGTVNPHHGTAVLGILVAKANGIGITGGAPSAKANFYPAFGGNGVGGRFFNAVASAVAGLKSGDIICIPMDFPVAVTDPVTGAVTVLQGTVLQSEEVFTLVQAAEQLGITTVVAAGNNCSAVVTAPTGGGVTGASNAVVVGAVWPGAQRFPAIVQSLRYCRADFSNFSGQAAVGGADEVDVAGWGSMVCTTGYGDLWRGSNSSSDPNATNNLRTYTMQFGGTSAASAMVAAAAARMQSTANVIFGTPLTPAQVKNTIRANTHLQCGFPAGSPLQLGSTTPCSGDNQAGAQVNSIRGFINAGPGLLTTIANQPFGSLPPGVTNFEAQVLVGRLLSGSVYSLRANDSNWMKIQAKRFGTNLTPAPGAQIFFPPTAVLTDLMVTITTSLASQDELYSLGVNAFGQAQPPTWAYTIFFVYNVNTQRWLMLPDSLIFFADEDQPEADGDVNVTGGNIGELYNVANFLELTPTGGKIRVRVVTIGPPIAGGYQAWWDLISIVPNPPPAPPDPCWVARAAYGRSSPKWVMFRQWLDTKAPQSFRAAYLTMGKPFASWLRHSATAKWMVRMGMDQAIRDLPEQAILRGMDAFSRMKEGKALRERAAAAAAAVDATR